MIIETLLYNQIKDLNNLNEHFENQNSDDVVVSHKDKQWCNPKLKVYLLIVLKIISTSIAVYLAWDCNRKTNKLFKYVIIILAALFSDFYILFYFIYRILLNKPCNSSNVSKLSKAAPKLPKVKAPKVKAAPKLPKVKAPKVKTSINKFTKVKASTN